MKEVYTSDYLIIGCGIIGLSIARNLIIRYPDSKIFMIEKENDVAFHSSGRNSGVLHAGFYYTADSLKAKFTSEGNKQLKDYCKQKGIKINNCSKIVVAKDESELDSLFELEKRGKANGVNIRIIDEKELYEIDQNIKTHKYALLSPDTATVNPIEVNIAIKNELIEKGVKIFFNESYHKKYIKNSIITKNGKIYEATKIINTAGLYADKVAKDFSFSNDYTIIPFKGVYLKYTGKNNPVSTNVYPVPNLKNPFLGVHFTITVDGKVKIGPTSMPAFWRENYTSLKNFNISELINILYWESKLFISNAFGFRNLALEEIKKYNKKYFASLALNMVRRMDRRSFNEWGKPGIRAQLLNVKTKELVMDFVVESDENSIHILNAVSPAFTCSFPFANWVVENHIINK